MKSDALSLNNFLGCAIADLRKTFGFTQKDFAKIINVSDSSLAHYEQGISFPSIDTLIRIADYFHVNVDYLLGRSENRPEYRKMPLAFCGFSSCAVSTALHSPHAVGSVICSPCSFI